MEGWTGRVCLGHTITHGPKVHLATGEGDGGSSVLNYMLYVRENRKDYDWEFR